MCGLVAMYKESAIEEKDIEMTKVMCEVMTHRGPNDKGLYSDESVILGFRRLSIIDLANGHQPYSFNDDKYHIVFNGEVYNYREIREELKGLGYTFTTDTEVEVMLSAYKEFGKEAIKKFRGMFSFIIWDKETETMYAVRDPFGIKPLYYMYDNESLIISSEEKAFFYTDKDVFKVNEEGLQHYLTFQYVPEPMSILKDIQIIRPGHMLIKEKGQAPRFERYYKVEFKPEPANETKKIEEIREALEDSVNIHMRSDVPVGSFLSGGIDSTIIVALARKLNPALKTFTVGFEVEGYSEMDLAAEIASELGVENIRRVVSAQEYMDTLPKILWHLDGPVADPSAIPIYFISEEASKHVTVVLSGEGSDEMFGGYTIYRESESLKMFDSMPQGLKKALLSASQIMPEGVRGKSFLERGCTPVEDRYFGNANIFREEEKKIYLPKYDPSKISTKITKEFYDELKGADGVVKMQYIDINTWLRGDILVKSDRMTMAHSLELRVPFLDKRVMEVCSRLDRYEKIGNNTTKSLLREAFASEIPSAVKTRRKLGYPVPIRVWLKNEMYQWAKDIFARSEAKHLINTNEAIKLLDAHRTGEKDYSRKIWTLLCFALWYEEANKRNLHIEEAACAK
ncbi:asparagine synthase (glutamine-hydrolyzing) [Clostridium cellulovorans]|uniref:asparagine synthase (glutamine-hydrolyzing) n=1 Tax=Clostridium cellulovorans (strain ATCC 35296 / DSM 3052 / OCM 3 / 743B) TaxID=573061 RepID=D9SKY7_CLOC7|nr:asparagine synthase (glutamine-hydrolyzing) [Clostridium cellulovorans]ADL53559.1 asparagine synthase (glutamine-hydrolyzing) [Clostridium cellulovorans 743B]